MTLVPYEYESHGVVQKRLTVCPCGHQFSENEPRWKHFLDEHDPEDFGLSPLGEVAEPRNTPLFDEPALVADGGRNLEPDRSVPHTDQYGDPLEEDERPVPDDVEPPEPDRPQLIEELKDAHHALLGATSYLARSEDHEAREHLDDLQSRVRTVQRALGTKGDEADAE